jgi:ribonucleotide monophosphatase NagD (HAD superfamily)
MLGGERRVRNNLKLITENYLWRGGQGILSGGVRFVGDRFATDIALVAPIGMDMIFVFPVLNFVYVF